MTVEKEISKKVNKSAFVRSLDPKMPAAKVVETAKAQGVKLTAAFVYTVRSTSKLSRPRAKAKDRSPRTLKGMSAAETKLRSAIADLGLVKATEILERVRRAIRQG